MHLKTECIACLVDRGVFECKLAIKDENLQLKCMQEFCEVLSRETLKNPNVTPSYIGTFRDRIIKRAINNFDYYKELKKQNNIICFEILKEVNKNFEKLDNDEKLKFLIKCAIIGNSLEYGVKGNRLMENNNVKSNFFEILKKQINLKDAIEEIKKSKKILYLADNNGEIIFDIELIKFLIENRKEVTLAIKEENIMDDFSFDDLENLKKEFNTNFNFPIISCGNYIGQYFKSAPKEFFEELKKADLVIAKGMANFETLEEEYKKFKINKKTLYLLMAKCQPIADALNVQRYSLVAKIL